MNIIRTETFIDKKMIRLVVFHQKMLLVKRNTMAYIPYNGHWQHWLMRTKMVTRLFLSLPFAKYGGAQVEQLHWMWIKVFIIKFHQMAAVEWNTITSIKRCSSSPPTFVLPDKFFCFQIPAEFCCISSLYILPFYSFLWIICLMFCN